jgi:superfamily II DNA helicase RecQ
MAASMEDAAGLLNDVFGYKEFRTSQHEVVETLLVK